MRKWLAAAFDGCTYPERFLTLSTAYPVETHFENIAIGNYMADAEEWCGQLRVPSLWRVLVPASADETDAALLSDAKKDRVFDDLVSDGSENSTYHRTLYRVHQRVAGASQRGSVVLAGDAAHLNNRLGGFGMKPGIHVPWNLTTKLREIYLAGVDAEARLSHYDRQRRTVATEFVQEQTILNKAAMEASAGSGKTAQEARLETLLGDDELRRAHLTRQAMILSLQREARSPERVMRWNSPAEPTGRRRRCALDRNRPIVTAGSGP